MRSYLTHRQLRARSEHDLLCCEPLCRYPLPLTPPPFPPPFHKRFQQELATMHISNPEPEQLVSLPMNVCISKGNTESIVLEVHEPEYDILSKDLEKDEHEDKDEDVGDEEDEDEDDEADEDEEDEDEEEDEDGHNHAYQHHHEQLLSQNKPCIVHKLTDADGDQDSDRAPANDHESNPMQLHQEQPHSFPATKRGLTHVCVFCGSRSGNKDVYAQASLELGKVLVEHKIGLVYGGGGCGLMGLISNVVHNGGGHVIGVLPRSMLPFEVSGETMGELKVVEDMHARKTLMTQLADAFIALPGGYGTLEELLEVITYSQLGIHNKPVGVLNVDGYYDPLLNLFNKGVEEGFITSKARELVIHAATPRELIAKIAICAGKL